MGTSVVKLDCKHVTCMVLRCFARRIACCSVLFCFVLPYILLFQIPEYELKASQMFFVAENFKNYYMGMSVVMWSLITSMWYAWCFVYVWDGQALHAGLLVVEFVCLFRLVLFFNFSSFQHILRFIQVGKFISSCKF